YSFQGSDFANTIGMTASSNASALTSNAATSVGATASPATNTLNMIPLNYNQVTSTYPDPSTSLPQWSAGTAGSFYLLNLHGLAVTQPPTAGSGGGGWFVHGDGADQTKPLADVSSIFQGTTNILTGQLSGPLSSVSSTSLSQA